MDIVLIGGLWLDGTCWDRVAPGLEAEGHRVHAVTLPGQGDGRERATLEDQVDAVVAAVDATSGPVLVVGHSAACSLAWVAADRRPDRVSRVALVGGMPAADGTTYADHFAAVDGRVPFPGWEPFAGPDSDDISEELRDTIASRAHPVPEAVTKGVVSLSGERRYDVPVVMVCPEYSPDEARAWVDAGEIPELHRARSVEYVDIDSGHWPMFTRPDALASLLAGLAT